MKSMLGARGGERIYFDKRESAQSKIDRGVSALARSVEKASS
jgi:hypothetical protein